MWCLPPPQSGPLMTAERIDAYMHGEPMPEVDWDAALAAWEKVL